MTDAIAHDATAADVQAALQALPHIHSVRVAVYGSANGTVCDATGASTAVTFTHSPGNQPPIIVSTCVHALESIP